MYTAVIGMTLVVNIVMMTLVHENTRIAARKRQLFTMVGILISVSALSEWGSVMLDGTTVPHMLHAMVKCSDHIFTPMLTLCYVLLFDDNKRVEFTIFGLSVVNIIVQVLSLFTGWTYYIDAGNVFHEGPYYWVYMVIYVLMYLCCFISFLRYCRNFKKQNLISLVMIFLSILAGITVQEALGDDYRIFYLTLAISNAFLFIHYSEFYQQKNDEYMDLQNRLLRTDTLTQMKNRYSYVEVLNTYDGLPDKRLTVFSLDINGLKRINDTYGHSAGDELIRGAADVIREVLDPFGVSFRTGGDEFISITTMTKDEIALCLKRIDTLTAEWHGKYQPDLSISTGYAAAADHPGENIQKLLIASDQMMYRRKEEHYALHPENRR